MDKNTPSSSSDETRGMKIARYVAWIVIVGMVVYFFVYAALFH